MKIKNTNKQKLTYFKRKETQKNLKNFVNKDVISKYVS